MLSKTIILTFIFSSLISLFNAQNSEFNTISEIEYEKKQPTSNSIERTNEIKVVEVKITKEAVSSSSTTYSIIDANLHQRFLNKEFRDHITSLFGVDHLVVSLNEPSIKITILNTEIEKILIEKLGLTSIQISSL
jgi:hypothetical protein